METIAKLVISTAEFVEAEGRVLKRQVVRLAAMAGLSIVALVAVIVGFVMIMTGCYQALAHFLGPASASLIMGAIWLAAGLGVLAFIGRRVK